MTDLMPPNLAADPPIPDDELDDRLNPDTRSTEPWEIGSVGEAEWAMRHVAEADQHIRQVNAQVAEWQARNEKWQADQVAKAEARRAFFAHHLERYMLDQRVESGGKVKSLDLPSGQVKTRASQPKAVVADVDEFVAWVETTGHDDLAPAVRKPALKALRAETEIVEVIDEARLILGSGDIVPCCRTGWVGMTDEHMGAGQVPTVGDTVAGARVEHVEILHAHWAVRLDDHTVPGVDVDPGGVTVTVTSIGGA